jgi:hypothetical protein
MVRYLYSELAAAIEARRNCADRNNQEWLVKWTQRIQQLEQLLPSGSGIDCGTIIDLEQSHAEKLVMRADFHHVYGGMYDGWTGHIITVTPSFRGINLRISGRNRNDIKEYLYDTYDYALKQEVSEITAYRAEDTGV